ncbi:hypothetical protein CgunFtcFv8_002281 [Champsocephalus gunnari]|uniref:Uncharacterized protein n=1 Tax=Champsocephalus gunnari TaxID=52237 RepID=A0AAN8H8J2_CHAGU|nr:hypothetical protein CgunFtcFv8_002281 [Champsocephalus gunnari]
MECGQRPVGAGQRRLQVQTQDVDAQQGARGNNPEQQLLLERHPCQVVCVLDRELCVCPALLSWRDMGMEEEKPGVLCSGLLIFQELEGEGFN